MLRNILRNPCNLYFALWCGYLLQGTLYRSGSFLSQGTLLLIFLISIFHAWKVVHDKNNPIYMKGLNTLLLMYVVYGTILMLNDGPITNGLVLRPPTFNYLKTYFISLLPIYSCYYYAKKGHLNPTTIKVWTVLFLFVGIATYLRMEREALEALMEEGAERDEITNNMGYVMLSLIPCMLVYNKTYIQYIGIGICALFVVMSMKRGAILIAAITIMIYVYQKLKYTKGLKKIGIFVSIGIFLMLLFDYIQDFIVHSDYFQTRIEETLEGDTSSRDQIVSALTYFYLTDASFIQQLFGIGANGTLKIAENYAHNDWLETLINQGLLGIGFFAYYWICFYRTVKSKRYSLFAYNTLLLIFSICLIRTLFSMSIGDNTLFLSCMLGYALADKGSHVYYHNYENNATNH